MVILLIVLVTIIRIQNNQDLQNLEARMNTGLLLLQRTYSDINQLQNNAKSYVISGNEKYFTRASKLIFKTEKNTEDLNLLFKDRPAQLQNLITLENMINKKISYHTQLMDNVKYKKAPVEPPPFPAEENLRLEIAIEQMIKLIIDEEKQDFQLEKNSKDLFEKTLKVSFIILSSLAVVLLIVVLLILRQYLKNNRLNETLLKANQQLLQSIIDNSSNLIFVKEITGQYILVNKQFEFLFRGKIDDLKGKTDYEIFPKDIADYKRDSDLEIIKSGKEIRYEEVLPHTDGKNHTYITIKFPIKDSEDKIYAVGAISTDITENKIADLLTKENEKQIQTIFEAAPDAVIVIDEESKIVKWNRKAEELFKWKAEELMGKPIYDMIMAPRYRELHLEGIKRFLKTGQGPYLNSTIEIKALNKDKEEFDIELTISASRIKEKYIFIAFIREITKRKQLEKENQQTKSFLDSIIENIPDMIFVKDAKELRFVRFNKAGEKLLGYTSSEILGKNDYDFFPKEQADFFTSKDREVLGKGGLVDIPEEVIDTKDGKRWLHTKKISIKDIKGNPVYLLGISEDISQRKKLENDRNEAFKQLRESEEKTTRILENIGDAVIATDSKLSVTYMNPVAEKLTGWKEDEAKGKPVEEVFNIINEYTRQKVENPIIAAISEKRVVGLANDTILLKKDKTEIFISDTGSPIMDKDGEVTGAVLIFSDITEQRNSEKQIAESNKKFTQIFNFTPVPLSISELEDGRFMYVNDSFCETLGFTREELIGKTSLELKILRAEDRKNLLIYAKKNTHLKGIEIQLRKKNGEIIDALFSVELIEIDKTKSAVSAFVDITERKNSEQRITMVLENIGEGVIVADNNQRILLSNHIADEILGSEDSYYSSDWSDRYDIYYPDGNTIFPAQNLPIERALKGEPTYDVELILEDRDSKNKKLLKVSGQPIINQDNKVIAAVATLRDITKYKEMEKALEESEMKYRKLIGFRRDEDIKK